MLKTLTFFLATALATTALAEGGMLVIAPTRLIIKNGQRTAEAAITNPSDKTVRYRLDLVNQVMNASGTTTVTDTFAYSAKPMLRYMPRTIELAPGKRQTIRLMVTRPKDLPDGDYHSHLLFNEIILPVPAPSTTTPQKENSVRMRVGMSYSMGIPVIVQQGIVSSTISLKEAHLLRNEQGMVEAVEATFLREGNSEGNLMVAGTTKDGTKAFTPSNIRIYHERDDVTIDFPLDPKVKILNPQEVILTLSSGTREKPSIKTLSVK